MPDLNNRMLFVQSPERPPTPLEALRVLTEVVKMLFTDQEGRASFTGASPAEAATLEYALTKSDAALGAMRDDQGEEERHL